jgi:hypothetical protein
MLTSQLSPSAYRLRQQWEQQDSLQFKKFREDLESMQVINALAEMIAGVRTGTKIRTFSI